MRTRSRSNAKRNAEQTFPIRIRFDLPECGFGLQYAEMHTWLDERAGRDAYAWWADTVPGRYASAVYLRDPSLVEPFISTFNLTLTHYKRLPQNRS